MADEKNDLESLMRRALAGEQQAYAELLGATVRLLRPYLARRLSQPSEVEDLLQEILISVHKARHTYDGQRPYKPWVFSIARFRLRDHLRAHYADHLRHAVELSEVENFLSAEVTETPFDYESVKGEIRRLPERQATLLHLLHGEGCTAKEAAKLLGMSESAVKVAAHRAYKILRKRLER